MSNPTENRTANNLSALRADVAETTNVLKVTVDKLVDREDRLNALSARADDLNSSSLHFHGAARRVQRKMKWQSYKLTIIIGKSIGREKRFIRFFYSYYRSRCYWNYSISGIKTMEIDFQSL